MRQFVELLAEVHDDIRNAEERRRQRVREMSEEQERWRQEGERLLQEFPELSSMWGSVGYDPR